MIFLNTIDKRTALIGKNILFSFLLKAWNAIVIFLLVPYTLKSLGEYQNGVWLTMSSLLLWIDQMDIGLGNGLRNKLATFMAENNIKGAQEAVSSTFFMLILVVIPIEALICILTNTLDIYTLLNIDSSIVNNLSNIFTVASLFVCTTFVLKFVGNFYLGLQLPAVNNLLVTLGQTLSLIGTMVLYYNNMATLLSITIINTCAPLVIYIIAYIYSFNYRYTNLKPTIHGIKKEMVGQLFNDGFQFFLLQISGVILFMTSNILISKLFSPAIVTPYQIAYRYFSIILMVFTVICTPYWTATTDAYKRNDFKWIKKSSRFLDKILVMILVVIIIMIAMSPIFYKLWIGDAAKVPISMTIMMGVYMLITIYSLRFSFILNGIGALRIQLITTVIAALCYVPLAVLTSKMTNNITCLMTIMCLVNIPGLFINKIQLKKILSNKAKGIWIK